MRGWRKTRTNITKHLAPMIPDINEQLLLLHPKIQERQEQPNEQPNDECQKMKEKEEEKDQIVLNDDIQKGQEYQPQINIDQLIDWNEQKQNKLIRLLCQQKPKKTIYQEFIKPYKKSRKKKKEEQVIPYAHFLHKIQQINFKAFRIVRGYLVAQELFKTVLQVKQYQQISNKSQGNSIKTKMVKFYCAWRFDDDFRLQDLRLIATDIMRALNNWKMREGFLRVRQKKQEKVLTQGQDQASGIKTERYLKYKAKKQQNFTQQQRSILNFFKKNMRASRQPFREDSEEKQKKEREQTDRKAQQSIDMFEGHKTEKRKKKQYKTRVTTNRKNKGKRQ